MIRYTSAAFILSVAAAAPALAEAPRVMTDVPPVHSLVARVMAGVGEPDLLLPPGSSPHDFALRPSDAARLSEASIVIWAGEGLTPWLEGPLATLAPDAVQLELLETEGWTKLEVREDAAFAHDDHEHGHDDDADDDPADDDHAHDDHAHDEHAHDDHAHDDHAQDEHAHDDHAHDDHAHGHDHADGAHVHEGTDPHAWLDPAVAKAWVGHIAEALSAADPANAAAYLENATAAQAEFAALSDQIQAQLEPFSGRNFIVPHDAYQYFETRFALPAAGAITLSDAGTPGPSRIVALRDQIAAGGIVCVLTDPQTSDEWSALLREGADVKTAQVDPDGTGLQPGPDLYPAIITGIATALADCLS